MSVDEGLCCALSTASGDAGGVERGAWKKGLVYALSLDNNHTYSAVTAQ